MRKLKNNCAEAQLNKTSRVRYRLFEYSPVGYNRAMNEQTRNHYWGIFIILAILTGAIGIGVVMGALNDSSKLAQEAPAPTESGEDLPRFTLEDVARHAEAKSCYMAAYGSVYDVTPAVEKATHPGGQSALLSGCGKEVSALFDRIHSGGAKADLEEFKIGVLAEE